MLTKETLCQGLKGNWNQQIDGLIQSLELIMKWVNMEELYTQK